MSTSPTEQTSFLMTLEFRLFAVCICIIFRLLILQVAAYFAGQVSGVDKREGKAKEKERGNEKKEIPFISILQGFP